MKVFSKKEILNNLHVQTFQALYKGLKILFLGNLDLFFTNALLGFHSSE